MDILYVPYDTFNTFLCMDSSNLVKTTMICALGLVFGSFVLVTTDH